MLIVLVVAGCGSINVHLYTRNLSLDDIKQAQDSLVSQGLTVTPNELDIPSDITSPTIIYSSMDAGGARQFELLTESLEKAGWPHIQHQLLLSGNHWHTKNNVGLILTASNGQEPTRFQMTQVAGSYHPQGCSDKLELLLNIDGTY